MSSDEVQELRLELVELQGEMKALTGVVRNLEDKMWKVMLLSLAMGLGGGAGASELLRTLLGS